VNLENCFALRELSLAGCGSWLFVVALFVKVASTAVGLASTHGTAKRQVSSAVWWSSKLSALVLCLAADMLCLAADDQLGQVVFFGLLVVASGVVAHVGRARAKEHARFGRARP
jgi:hypothetical protein